MDIVELGARLDRLEQSNRRLRALEQSNRRLRAIVVGLAVVLWFTTVVILWPARADAQGRVVTAQAFLLLDDAGQIRADLSIVDGSPRLAMWQPGVQQPAVRLETDVNGLSQLVMWQPGAQQATVALGIDNPAEGFGTHLRMGDLANGTIDMTTSRDGRQPAAHIFPPGGGTAVWSAP